MWVYYVSWEILNSSQLICRNLQEFPIKARVVSFQYLDQAIPIGINYCLQLQSLHCAKYLMD